MNLKQLLFVKEVARTRSFSKAAEHCFATQPTLSNAISQLEKEVGGRLFTRTTRKVEPTPFGEYLLPYIEAVLSSRDELTKAAESFHNPSHKLLRIGFSPLVDMRRLDQVLKPFLQDHPDISLFFKECFVDELSTRLQREQIDFKVIQAQARSEGESSRPFYRDALYYLPVIADRQEAGRLAFVINELPATPIILTGGGCGLNGALSDLFGSQDTSFRPYEGQALSYKIIEDWAALGIGASILPKSKLSPDNRAAYPLFLKQDIPASLDFEWVWNAQRDLPEYLRAFLDYIEHTVPLLVDGRAENGEQRGVSALQ